MKSVNKVILIGTLGRDPEIKSTSNGSTVAKFSVATNERFKSGNEWQDRTEWHNIICWQRLAEIARDYCHKGDRIYIEGRLQTSSWEDKQTGEKKYRTEIVANDLVLLGGRRNDDDAPSARHSEPPAAYQAASTGTTDDLEDIPF